jgi:antitoxin component YwqK of YwqJK toxin-antitoxin module
MRNALLVLIVLLAISCGKKKQIVFTGESQENGVITERSETFIDHDSAFETHTDVASGKIYRLERSKNMAEFSDSTYTVELFFIPSGKPKAFKKYIAKKREGEWKTFYESGKVETETDYKNNLMLGYKTWFEDGKLKAIGEPLPDHTFRHQEFFENGVQSKEMATDSTGDGKCTYWYPNKRMKSTGPICGFEPCGVWKGWDTAGKAGPDELLGIPSK